ncbi:hypothetical protein [Streptomyces tagetis]|nr:hypothetical protein [Streptomyces sp. RG38]
MNSPEGAPAELMSLALPGRLPNWNVRLLCWGTGMMTATSALLAVEARYAG